MRSKRVLFLLALLFIGLGVGLHSLVPWSPPASSERVAVGASGSTALAVESGQYTLARPEFKQVELRSTWTNLGPNAVTDLHIYVGVPAWLPEQQLAQSSWSQEPSRYFEDRYGQRIAEFVIPRVSPGEKVTIGFTAIGWFWQIKYNIDPQQVGSLAEIPQEILELYTADGPYYRLSDPLILSTAAQVVGEERNPYLMALKIHDFVARTLSYDLDGEWDDAPIVLRRGSGSCSEFTFVFVALARAVGLPARYSGGSIYLPQQGRGGAFIDYYNHRWAEAYIPGYGWVPFDPTWDQSGPGQPVSREYVGSHGHALVFSRGDVDERYLGVSYIDGAVGQGPAELRAERRVVWSDPR
ncbi:MAG: transglutaminase domain-containing protein [Candidatus Acetothermia bacterium]|nr:transglutaminase domain-containing protein [Candidatus Acetothermia bacterium]MDH7505468.1 transglutaminase domain-containing protein [Candidatus Acetothermia bacterium]